MLWIACLLLGIAMMAVSLRVYFKRKQDIFRAVIALGCLLVATFVLYIPPFFETYGIMLGTIGDVLQVLRAISLDADMTVFYGVIMHNPPNEFLGGVYVLMIGTLHVALPAVSALTAVTVLLRCFSAIQLFFANHRRRSVFVFSEVNDRALQLAKSLENMNCDIVFASSNAEEMTVELGSKHKPIFKEESISELNIKVKQGKDIYFFCISEDENLSLSHMLQLIEKFSKVEEEDQEQIHIYQFSKEQDFSIFVDSSDKGLLDVHCINEYETLAYNLLDQYSLVKTAGKDVHVLLHGLSGMNVVALRAVAWCGQLSGIPLRISVVGVDLREKQSELMRLYPGLFTDHYNIRFFSCESKKEVEETIGKECKDANYIIVSEETDNDTMELGISLRRLFYKLDPEFSYCPPIFCYVQEVSKAHLLKNLTTAETNPKRKMSYDLTPFGSLDEVFTYERLVNSPLEKLSKNVHLAYEEIFSDGQIDVKQALKRYNLFEVNKRSNRANALHIRYKLNMLGLDYTEAEDVQEVSLQEYCTKEDLAKMAYCEHSRWMAFLESEGWSVAEREDALAYRNSGISKGRHNCPILKMHPYICDYEKLKDLSLELENKDTTVYDEELIVRIPDILGDKWNVIGKKYKIVKM
jgi:hypothetical protein